MQYRTEPAGLGLRRLRLPRLRRRGTRRSRASGRRRGRRLLAGLRRRRGRRPGRRLAGGERADRGRVLGRLPLRLPRHPAAPGRVADQAVGGRARPRLHARRRTPTSRQARRGRSASSDAATRCGSSGTSTRATRRARSPISYTLTRCRRRVRRRRRREPQGLGRPVGRAARPPGRQSRPRRGRSCAAWGKPVWVRGDVELVGTPRDAARRLDIPAHQFVELRTLIPRSAFSSTERDEGRARGPRSSGSSRRSSRTPQRFERDRERIDSLKAHPLRTGLVLLGLAHDPRAARDRARVLVHGPRAPDRLRPRVRAGAADGHRARARPDASSPGRRGRLVRVHGDALRPHPARRLQGGADDDGAVDLGRAAPREDLRPRGLGRRGAASSARGSATSRTSSTAFSTAGASGSRASATRSRTSASR